MTDVGPEGRRGTLFPERLPTFDRIPAVGPAADLLTWVWVSQWDLPEGEVSRQHLLAFPASNLVVEPDLVGLSGPTTRASHRDLVGAGWGVGALLRPAAVPTFSDDPAGLRDRYVEVHEPELRHRVARAIVAGGPHAAAEQLTSWLSARVGQPTEEALLANRVAEVIGTDASVRTLADVCERVAVSERTLHRLTRRYVGLTPSVMIRRRRLQEAAERVREEAATDLGEIAADLGYADQAHLTREFRAVLGFTPSGYRREVAR